MHEAAIVPPRSAGGHLPPFSHSPYPEEGKSRSPDPTNAQSARGTSGCTPSQLPAAKAAVDEHRSTLRVPADTLREAHAARHPQGGTWRRRRLRIDANGEDGWFPHGRWIGDRRNGGGSP